MADEEHLAQLRQGVTVWNAWKRKNPDIRPYLVEANLIRMDLSEANLELCGEMGDGPIRRHSVTRLR